MPKTNARSAEDYLAQLPPDRRAELARVRKVVLDRLPHGYEEMMTWGMISYAVPLERYPNTYNGQPLGYAALAAQKNYFALYLLGAYMEPAQRTRLERAYDEAGKRMDMGKSCLRFRAADDLPLDVIGELIAGMPVERLIALYEEAHPPRAARKSTAKKSTARKSTARKSTGKKSTGKKSTGKKTTRKRKA